MKILAIRGCNIASLEGNFEIDFTQEPLATSGIYAITGPTGAGKSTILDALSLALYEETPRLTKAGENKIPDVKTALVGVNNPVTLMRRGATEAFAEVDFVGIDGIAYRSRWSVRRGHKKANNPIQTPTITLIRLDNQSEYPEKKKGTLQEIARLVGLSYDQFTRTVLLAQGDFALFLKANDSDRASLLEKLTGTSIYTQISMRVYNRTEEVRKELDSLRSRMDSYHLLSAEEELKYKEELLDLTAKIKVIDTEYQHYQQFIAWYSAEENFLKQITITEQGLQNQLQLRNAEENNRNLLKELSLVADGFTFLKDKNDISAKLLALTNEIARLQTEISQNTTLITAQEALLAEASLHLQQFEDQEEIHSTQMKQAYALEAKLKDIEDQFVREDRQLTSIKLNKQTKENEIIDIDLNYRQWEQKNKTSVEWLLAQQQRKDVAENYSLIFHHLQQAGIYLTKIKSLAQDEKNETDKKESLIKQIGELQIHAQSSVKLTEDVKQKLLEKQSLLDKKDFPILKENLEKESRAQNELLELIHLWNLIEPSKKEFKNNEDKHETTLKERNELQVELTQQQNRILLLQGKYQIAEQNFERIRQIATENVASLRTTLKDNQPCPVCGSEHHPYQHQSDDHFKQLLDEAKKLYDQLKTELTSANQLTADLLTQVSIREQNLTNLTQRNIELKETLDTLSAKWVQNSFSSSFPLANTSLNEADLLKALNQSKARINQYSKEIDEFDLVRSQIVTLTNDVRKEENNLQQIQQQLISLNERVVATSDGLNTIRIQIQENNVALEVELSAVDGYFRNATWRTNWAQNASAFVASINSFVTEWNIHINEKEESSRQLTQLISNREIQTRNLQAISVEYKRVEENKQRIHSNRNQIKQDLGVLLGDKTITELEAIYIHKKEKLTNDKQLASQQLNLLKEQKAGLTGQKTALETQRQLSTDKLTQITYAFNEWLQALNTAQATSYSEESLTTLMAISPEWISEKQTILTGLDRAIFALESELKIHRHNLENHHLKKPALIDREDLLSKTEENRQQKEVLEQEGLKIRTLLQQHNDSMQTLADLQHLLNDKKGEYDSWSKLNLEIGKADGGKFKHIAQSYTLDLLLQTANVHIRTIAPRYRLQRIPETLSLLVIDRDMCDQIRSVHSLSGGETFLVSLSLALGLSSLSSRQLNIESLFIDEGFGSLDEESLMMAMDALESLRLQGRKVGVITHVKEMTERISTRIQVVKQQNGSSQIRIE